MGHLVDTEQGIWVQAVEKSNRAEGKQFSIAQGRRGPAPPTTSQNRDRYSCTQIFVPLFAS